MIKIEKGVPMPKGGKGRAPIWQNLLSEMEIGDSVVVNLTQAMSIRKAADATGRKVKQSAIDCPAGKCRMWRVE